MHSSIRSRRSDHRRRGGRGVEPRDHRARPRLARSPAAAQPVSTEQPSLGLTYLIRTEDPANIADLGQVVLFAGNFAPGGYSIADGQSLPIATNLALFSQIGTTYGGDGRTNFALPNLQGRTVVGTGAGHGAHAAHLGQRGRHGNANSDRRPVAAVRRGDRDHDGQHAAADDAALHRVEPGCGRPKAFFRRAADRRRKGR